jgi:hypothetical protein
VTRTLHGKVHGKTAKLDEDLGVVDGQEVEIRVKVISKPGKKTGERFLRTQGALADDEERDTIMEQVYQERQGEML